MKEKREAGFSLVEVIIVIVIIVVLASFAFPVFISVQERASITKDMSNLRQLAFATQRYLSDNDGVFFKASGTTWMATLYPGPQFTTQYISDWGVFESPFDTRSRGEAAGNTPVSYGINNYQGSGNPLGVDVAKVVNPSAFIFFAPAQNSGPTVNFIGTAASPAPGVWVSKDTTSSGTVNCGGGSLGCGVQQKRQRINAVCADGHVDNMLWKYFKSDASTNDDPNGDCRWSYNCKATAAKPAAHQ